MLSGRAVRTMLDAIAKHYRRRSLDEADSALLGMIDRSIAEVTQDPIAATRELVLALGGIRRGLFPNAPPYAPEARGSSDFADLDEYRRFVDEIVELLEIERPKQPNRVPAALIRSISSIAISGCLPVSGNPRVLHSGRIASSSSHGYAFGRAQPG
jgi:hypothetical protein